MTGQEIIQMGLKALEIIAAGQTATSDELADGLVILNNMITGWNEMLEMNLAGQYASALYTFNDLDTYATLATASTASLGFQRAYIYNFAVEFASHFGKPVPDSVMQLAIASRQAVLTLNPPKG
jgi:hypothetical protein